MASRDDDPAASLPQPFDRRALRRNRERHAAGFAAHAFLLREVAERLAERLGEINRAFPTALALDARGGVLAQALSGKGGIEMLVQAELSPKLAAGLARPALALDEEALPFGPGSLDLVVSCLGLHWVNDLPGTLAQIRWSLKPDGLFLAAFPGGDTLHELRGALLRAELEVTGGASPRVSPFVDLRDAAALLQRAGMALPVADVDRLKVTYAEPLQLLADLRAMGETSALISRGRPLSRAVLGRASEIYLQEYGDRQGRIAASFDILFLAGWKPHESQQTPSPRGSGKIDLASVLGRSKRT